MGTDFRLQTKTTIYEVSDVEMRHYVEMFPNINVPQCLLAMRVWLDANPSKRPKLIRRFIANWLIADTRKADEQWREQEWSRKRNRF